MPNEGDGAQSQANKKIERRSRWISIAITTAIGVLATIAGAWFSIDRAEEVAITAELERARAVRDNFVAIVEERVINGKAVDTSRLTRLIDRRKKEQDVRTLISVREVVEAAEYNILNHCCPN